jgi:hypothetical protein
VPVVVNTGGHAVYYKMEYPIPSKGMVKYMATGDSKLVLIFPDTDPRLGLKANPSVKGSPKLKPYDDTGSYIAPRDTFFYKFTPAANEWFETSKQKITWLVTGDGSVVLPTLLFGGLSYEITY